MFLILIMGLATVVFILIGLIHTSILSLITRHIISEVYLSLTPGRVSLYRGVFNILKITTTTHNDTVCISFNSKSAHSDPPIYIYMQKEDSLSFPMVFGSGGSD
jgi:hypothetical protein